ncbi:hypothetical protein [Aquimarina sp. RZ0]|uniref:hypothetical protein n=1 Tax=Aquimarina sp. RZ0 TaxID=2607730 RepID=UPI0011F3EA6D|nr:hypothetical protein [Aquimarina sp. RZ0]KAA1244542.1 hypothetical protein F0000_16280 [Aquimarina sp. RZ0]
MKLNPLEFFDTYELIASPNTYSPIVPNECRYCGEKSEVLFKTDCHLIPELLGRNHFLSRDECDNCNQLFSKWESHLAIFARPYLSLSNIKTKNKVPIFQSRTDYKDQPRTSIKIEEGSTKRLIHSNLDDFILDTEKGLLQIATRNPGFIPNHIYRALCKIMLGMMPSKEFFENKDFFKWLEGTQELPEICHGFQYKSQKKYYKTPSAQLYKAKKIVVGNIAYPEFVGIISFANTIVQFYLPLSENYLINHSDQNSMNLVVYPSFAFDGDMKQNQKFKIRHITNFDQKEPYKSDEKFTFKVN